MQAHSNFIDIEGPYVRKPRSRLGQHLLAFVAACLIGTLMALSTSPGLL